MEPLTLYLNDGITPVARFLVPIWKHPVEVYVWGERFFVRRENGRYTEAAGTYCVTSLTEMPVDIVSEIGKLDDQT